MTGVQTCALPIFPALALLIGRYLAHAGKGVALGQAIVAAAVGLVAALAATQATRLAEQMTLPPALLAGYVPWLVAAGIALLAGAAIAVWFGARGRPAAAALSLAFGALATTQLGLSGYEQLAPAYSAYHSVRKIRSQLKPDAPFYVVNTFDHTLLFYLGRTVTMVSFKDELAKAIGWEPQKFLPDTAAFARAWEADREAFAMFAPNDLAVFLQTHPVPMQVIARDPRRVIVKKP